jgi:hypothetical protein
MFCLFTILYNSFLSRDFKQTVAFNFQDEGLLTAHLTISHIKAPPPTTKQIKNSSLLKKYCIIFIPFYDFSQKAEQTPSKHGS